MKILKVSKNEVLKMLRFADCYYQKNSSHYFSTYPTQGDQNYKVMDALKSNTKIYPLSLIHARRQEAVDPTAREIRRTMPEKIALPTMDGIQFEKVRNIVSLEAQGNYTFIHLTNGKRILVCKTLRETEAKLNTDAFVRVHRSFTVNLHLVSRYIKGKGGYVIMEDGTNINVSAGRKKEFLEKVGEFF